MTWISLVCLLALSSAAFGRSVSFDGYGSSRIIDPTPLPAPGYGREIIPEVPVTRVVGGYGSSFIPPVTRVLPAPSYGGYGSSRVLEREVIVDTLPPTQADILCRGQLPQTVIPIEFNRKFVTCLDDGKGVEQACPRGLLFHEGTQRCERKLGAPEDFCLSQPCLNGGLCSSLDSTFKCDCPAGFDGINCELDATFCQVNRPCGSDPFVRCQSFRPGAALQWLCVSDMDFTYGPDGSHIHKSLCDGTNSHMGPFPLAFTDKGFMMCNGEHTHYESCPGGTKWNDPSKACVWPDMEEIVDTRIISRPGYGGYGSSIITPAPVTRVFDRYGGDKVFIPRPKLISSGYGGEVRRVGYGGDVVLPAPMPETKVFTRAGYGGDVILPTPTITKVFPSSSYGGDVVLPAPMPETKVITEVRRNGYGGDVVLPAPMPETKFITRGGYGESLPVPETKFITRAGYGESLPVPETKVFTNNYGSSRLFVPSAPVVKVASSYGGY
jgi:hypothetical protein